MKLYGWCLKKQNRIANGKIVKYCFKISCKWLKLLGEKDNGESLFIKTANDFQQPRFDTILNAVMPKHR